MIDWFYNTFARFEDVEEVYLNAEGKEVRRWVRTYVSDPAWWLSVFFFLWLSVILCLATVIFALQHFALGNFVAGGIGGIVSFVIFIITYNGCTIRVREDQKCDRQIFGANRYFRNCPILYIPRWTQLAFFSSKQQTINSPTDPEDALAVTSWIMQEDPPINATLEQKRKVPRAEQVVLLKIVFTLAVKNLPKVLSEKYHDAFHKRWLDSGYDAMGKEVREKVLDIVGGNTDGVLQDFTMEELDADADEANKKLTKELLPLLRRIGIELEQVIVSRVLDMPGVQGYQYNAQKKTQAKQRSDKERFEAEQDRLSREKRAAENQAASEKEQEAREKIAEAETDALKKMILAERQRQKLANQAIIERMKAVADNAGALALAKLEQMSPEQVSEVIKTGLANINPNLQGSTLASVEGLGEFLKNLPASRLLEWLTAFIQQNQGAGTPPPAAPTNP